MNLNQIIRNLNTRYASSALKSIGSLFQYEMSLKPGRISTEQ